MQDKERAHRVPAADSASVNFEREPSPFDQIGSTRRGQRERKGFKPSLSTLTMDNATPALPASASTQPAASASEVSSRGRKRKAFSYAETVEAGRGKARRGADHEQQEDRGAFDLPRCKCLLLLPTRLVADDALSRSRHCSANDAASAPLPPPTKKSKKKTSEKVEKKKVAGWHDIKE